MELGSQSTLSPTLLHQSRAAPGAVHCCASTRTGQKCFGAAAAEQRYLVIYIVPRGCQYVRGRANPGRGRRHIPRPPFAIPQPCKRSLEEQVIWIDRVDKSHITAGTLPALVALLGSSLADLDRVGHRLDPSGRSTRAKSHLSHIRERSQSTGSLARQLAWTFMSPS